MSYLFLILLLSTFAHQYPPTPPHETLNEWMLKKCIIFSHHIVISILTKIIGIMIFSHNRAALQDAEVRVSWEWTGRRVGGVSGGGVRHHRVGGGSCVGGVPRGPGPARLGPGWRPGRCSGETRTTWSRCRRLPLPRGCSSTQSPSTAFLRTEEQFKTTLWLAVEEYKKINAHSRP